MMNETFVAEIKAKNKLAKSKTKRAKLSKVAKEVVKQTTKPAQQIRVPISTSIMVSTGSTLLDLAISGGRVRGGGLPGGIMVEIFGPSSSGKSSVLSEIGASVQNKGGDVTILDPEGRLDKEYSKVYGLKLDKKNYHQPDTVHETFKLIEDWEPGDSKKINLMAVDSLAALSTEMEMAGEDKRGQLKAKQLSEGCRKVARKVAKDHKLVVFTNQERAGDFGKTTPGGFAVGYHSSVRIRIARMFKGSKIEKTKILPSGVKITKVLGIKSECLIKKSSVDNEYRTAPLYIIFGLGIDDVRANLQYMKDVNKKTKYDCFGKEFARINDAIAYIEENNFEGELRETVIDQWGAVEALFYTQRKKKIRF